MTLSTDIYFKGPIDGPDLHRWVNENLLRQKLENVQFSKRTEGESYKESWNPLGTPRPQTWNSLNNRIGQGFDAIFELSWSDTPKDYDEGIVYDNEDDAEYGNEARTAIGPHFGQINFDTGYGYRGPMGEGCTELHASYIVRLYREYFEPRGIDIVWQNEYDGSYTKNLDQDGLVRFLGGGDAAMAWFAEIGPAIEAEAAAEGLDVSWETKTMDDRTEFTTD